MSSRDHVLILALALCGCQLPESDGAKPSEASLIGSTPTSTSRAPKKELRPKSLVKPTEPTAPKGEETGALVGLRAAHDEARAAVGVAALEWSPELGVLAQKWAKQLAANNCQLAHRPNSSYGENLYWTSSSATAEQVVAAWTAEREQYDAAMHTCTGDVCGHYTQVVWSKTTKLGCGMASCGSQQVWVCNYDPRGNVTGQHPV
jgi:uncharacterized protein YkwD